MKTNKDPNRLITQESISLAMYVEDMGKRKSFVLQIGQIIRTYVRTYIQAYPQLYHQIETKSVLDTVPYRTVRYLEKVTNVIPGIVLVRYGTVPFRSTYETNGMMCLFFIYSRESIFLLWKRI